MQKGSLFLLTTESVTYLLTIYAILSYFTFFIIDVLLSCNRKICVQNLSADNETASFKNTFLTVAHQRNYTSNLLFVNNTLIFD